MKVDGIIGNRLSHDQMTNGFVNAGYNIKARVARNIKYSKTKMLNIFPIVGCVLNSATNYCYLCKGVHTLNNGNDLVVHSHNYRQFGLIKLLSQVVDLHFVVGVIREEETRLLLRSSLPDFSTTFVQS
jgi:hypothetical protein